MNNIIYFDSECSICSSFIRILIFLDKKDVLRFSSNKSKDIKRFRIENSIDSIILVSNKKYYLYSDAIFKIIELLGFNTTLLYIIPKFIRDNIYKFIAKYRKASQKNIQCYLPDSTIQHKFLDIHK